MLKKFLLFFLSFLITISIVVVYYIATRKIAKINMPVSPVSLSDVVKFSRFSLEKAPSESLVGEVTLLKGEVEYEARLATEAGRLDSSIPVQQGETFITKEDGEMILKFDKAAEIVISPNSSVGIIQTLPVNLVFNQTKGSASYKKLSNIPVSIRCKHLLIENSGEVKVEVDEDGEIVTLLMNSGSAIVAYNDSKNITQKIDLTEGESFTFNDGTRKGVLK